MILIIPESWDYSEISVFTWVWEGGGGGRGGVTTTTRVASPYCIGLALGKDASDQ